MEWVQQLSYTTVEQGAWLLQRQLPLEYLDVSFVGKNMCFCSVFRSIGLQLMVGAPIKNCKANPSKDT